MSATIPTELGSERIGVLLKRYAVPAIIAMTASSLYNTVDSIFIGRKVGSLALSAFGVCFPLMNLSTALGMLAGVGGSTMLSILLGQRKYEETGKVLGNIVSLNLIIGGLFTVAGLIWINPILRLFGASDSTLPYARDYMKIILYGNIITHLYFGLNAAMRSSGNPKYAMNLTLFTVIFNIILDYIFIFILEMGVRGAAIATVLVQTIALIVVSISFSRKIRPVHFEKGIVRFNWKIAKDSLMVGMGPFLMNAAACLVNIIINNQMYKYQGDLGIAAFGIVFKISFIFLVIVMGLNQGMQPIAGYNYGARLYTRVRKVYLLTTGYAVGVATVGFILSMSIPRLMCGMFTTEENLLDLASKGLRLMNLALPIVGFQMVSTNFFQSLGMVNKSIFLSLCRQLLFLIPCIYLLPLAFEAFGVWLSFPASDLISSGLTFLMIRNIFKKFDKLNDGDAPYNLGGRL